MLEELCARNVRAYLRYETQRGRKLESRVRFLGLHKNRLLIDVPMLSGRPIFIPKDEKIRLFYVWQEQRFAFTASIIGRAKWEEAGTVKLDALLVSQPRRIERAQRRGCYRLSIAKMSTCILRLWPVETDDEALAREMCEEFDEGQSRDDETSTTLTGPAPQQAEADAPGNRGPGLPANPPEEQVQVNTNASIPDDGQEADAELPAPEPPPPVYIEGRLANISETGCGAVFEHQDAARLEPNSLYRAVFELPGLQETFDLVTELRWKGPHPAGDRIMAGMAWQLDPQDRDHRLVQSTIGRFIAEAQREALRRAKTDK